MSKPYVLADLNNPEKLKVEYRSSARGTICPIDDELVGKAFRVIELTEAKQVPRPKLDADDKPIFEAVIIDGKQVNQPVYQKDAQGNVITDEVIEVVGYKAELDEAAEAQRLADKAAAKLEDEARKQALDDLKDELKALKNIAKDKALKADEINAMLEKLTLIVVGE